MPCLSTIFTPLSQLKLWLAVIMIPDKDLSNDISPAHTPTQKQTQSSNSYFVQNPAVPYGKYIWGLDRSSLYELSLDSIDEKLIISIKFY